MQMGAEVYQNLKKVVKSRYGIDGKEFCNIIFKEEAVLDN